MNRWSALLLAVLCITLLSSCNADPTGLVTSSDVDRRFEDSPGLPGKPDLAITGTSFSFVVISDTHVYGGTNANLAALPGKLRPDDKFILACGDLSQCGDRQDLESLANYLNQTGLPYYTTPGNHDLYNGGWNNYRQILGKSCYALTAGPILIISMDSANGTIGRKQKDWLEGVLNAKTQPLCVVFTHFEFFSPNPTNIQQFTDIEEVYYLMHLFETRGVNYVFMGHSHIEDHRLINGIHYLTVADFTDDGFTKAFFRVTVNGTEMSHQRVEISN